GIMDYPTPDCKTPDEALTVSENLINKYKGDPLVSVAIAPHSPYTCSKETLLKVKGLFDKYHVPVHIHLSETEKEIKDVLTAQQMRPPAFINSVGLLNEKTIAAHCICLDQDEINMLCDKKVGVAHCPTSNMKLAEKVAPVTPMLRLNMKVSFGTDGAPSNNNLSILSEMKIGSLLQKLTYANPTVVNAPEAVRMATIEAAKVLSLDDKIGSLEKGKYGDVIIVDLSEPHVTPSYDPYSTILYSVEESDIQTVIINGQVVMKNRELLTIDKQKAIDDVNRIIKQLMLTGIKSDRKNSGCHSFQLNQNYPNPFNPTTTIRYSIPRESFVELKVFDLLGREVTTLINKEQSPGEYKVQFDGSSLPSGVYIYTIQAGQYRASKKLMLLK
ncbi:MAG: amidohydrolase family protein, partial [Bacillota bacterium]